MSERSIFLSALDIAEPAERAAYLAQACGNDANLRRHIEELVAMEARLGGFLVRPHADVERTDDFAPGVERPGTQIGPYKLLEQIGEGGFGVVFMAEQQQPVRRKVALKVLKAGMDTRQVIARFEAERQALALMDHPNIARVLDAGETASGRPYFVMELVKGIPITQFCDEGQLTTRERLALFITVCQAAQHAHQKGIIHRDIKPTNVLVTLHDGTPVVKVIDFGVAKATGHQLTEKTLFTGFAQMVGTPLYMSPEQAALSGLDIDTRSDIYSLGVLLYELLTGTTPLQGERLKQAAFDEIRRIIREEEPIKPSTRISTLGATATSISAQRKTEPRKLSQLLRNELDWIVMKALEKDRTRRYETASAFAADVGRYLRDEQVTACPPSWNYRLSKVARRHKTALTVAAGFVALLIAGVVLSAWQAIRATNAQAIAVANERKSIEAVVATKQARDAEARQRQLAQENEQSAIQEKNNVLAAREELRHTLYASEMNLVQSAVESKHYSRAHQLLKEQPADLRGFEWHYWHRKLQHGWLRSVAAPSVASVYRWSGTHVFSRGAARLAALVSYQEESRPGQGPRMLTMVDGVTGCELLAPFDPFADLQGMGGSRLRRRLSLSDDGKRLAVALIGSRGNAEEGLGLISIRDGESGDEIRRLKAGAGVYQIALSPDGDRIAVQHGFSADSRTDSVAAEVNVWNTTTEELELPLPKLPWIVSPGYAPLACVLWSPDGTRLLRHSVQREMPEARARFRELFQMIDLATEEVVWERETFNEYSPTSFWSWSPDGSLLAILEVEDEIETAHGIQLWNSRTGATVASIERTPTSAVNANIAFSPDGRWLASICNLSEIRVWEMPALPAADGSSPQSLTAPRMTFFASKPLFGVSFSADGRQLQGLGGGSTIDTWDTTNLEDQQIGPESLAGQFAAEISPDANMIAMDVGDASRPNPVNIVWDLQRNREVLRTTTLGFGYGTRPAFSHDGRRVAFVGSAPDRKQAQITIGDTHTGAIVKTIPVEHPESSFTKSSPALSSDGGQVALLLMFPAPELTRRPARLVAWDTATGAQRFSVPVISNGVDSPEYSADDQSLVLAANEHEEEAVWFDASTGERRRSVALPEGGGRYWINERTQLVGSSNQEIALWDLATGRQRLRLPNFGRSTSVVTVSPDGSRLALGIPHFTNEQTELRLLNAKTGRLLLSIERQGFINSVAFSADGNRLVATFSRRSAARGNALQPIQFWDATPLPEEVAK